MTVNLLLIASESDNQEIYLRLLENIGHSITVVPSFNDLEKTISDS
jgi:hypothetical protein